MLILSETNPFFPGMASPLLRSGLELLLILRHFGLLGPSASVTFLQNRDSSSSFSPTTFLASFLATTIRMVVSTDFLILPLAEFCILGLHCLSKRSYTSMCSLFVVHSMGLICLLTNQQLLSLQMVLALKPYHFVIMICAICLGLTILS